MTSRGGSNLAVNLFTCVLNTVQAAHVIAIQMFFFSLSYFLFIFFCSCNLLVGKRRKPVSAKKGVYFCLTLLHNTVIAVDLAIPSLYHFTYSWSSKLEKPQ